ncbi:GLPGLI family protein [Chryseobacterium sp.]|uniref:GLPGLI family protein n=1 Tax=Chryseobacterium sp. TaxID=1871047 RepID=UPI0028A28E83|nr:GLPGLI family protein [Chryseobacterium sp.]
MKILSTSLFFLIAGMFSAQSTQFIYEYKFKPDSLNRDQVITENMVLESKTDGSRFVSQKKITEDSLLNASIKQMMAGGGNHIDMSKTPQPKVRNEVVKKYPSYETTFKTSPGSVPIAVAISQKPDWKVSTEKSEVLGYKVQKATSRYAGREWTAWFAPEIPIQDGPHEFYGLPGLIVKIEDTKNDHSFVLIGTKKVSSDQAEQKPRMSSREIALDEEKFRKYWQDYKKDPVKDMRQEILSSSGGVVTSMTFNGKTYSKGEMIRDSEKSRKEMLKTENNYLNLNLYKP